MAETLIVRTSRSLMEDGTYKSNLGDLLRATIATTLYPDWLFATDWVGRVLVQDFLPEDRVIPVERVQEPGLATGVRQIVMLDNFSHETVWQAFPKAARAGYLPGEGRAIPANRWIDFLTPYRATEMACSWSEALVAGLGFVWAGQDYPIPEPVAPCCDVGLNHHVHAAWPSKSWPQGHWTALDRMLREEFAYTVTWQQGHDDLRMYKDWIRSCRVVVSCDSLGVHLASAYRRGVVALTGPTASHEYHYGRVEELQPTPRVCLPCHAPQCGREAWCMEELAPGRVAGACREILSRDAYA